MDDAGNEDQATTDLLNRAFRDGDAGAQGLVLERIYPLLRRSAKTLVRTNGQSPTSPPTAIVNEAIERLLGGKWAFRDTRHFLCFCAKAMSRILVDHARARNRQRRRPPGDREEIESVLARYEERNLDVIALIDEIEWLRSLDPELADIVDLHHFCELSLEETAKVLGLSPTTLRRRWETASALLRGRLQP